MIKQLKGFEPRLKELVEAKAQIEHNEDHFYPDQYSDEEVDEFKKNMEDERKWLERSFDQIESDISGIRRQNKFIFSLLQDEINKY
ncbi:hypothetical protein [Vibrio agarivorans]|uniref:hypothetical protein n=1 Tax=Vibrio agarivorans TaxID=153622 RepID=UPI00222EA3D4|nr:hypothetical protein [Vibrio agarivorans]